MKSFPSSQVKLNVPFFYSQSTLYNINLNLLHSIEINYSLVCFHVSAKTGLCLLKKLALQLFTFASFSLSSLYDALNKQIRIFQCILQVSYLHVQIFHLCLSVQHSVKLLLP